MCDRGSLNVSGSKSVQTGFSEQSMIRMKLNAIKGAEIGLRSSLVASFIFQYKGSTSAIRQLIDLKKDGRTFLFTSTKDLTTEVISTKIGTKEIPFSDFAQKIFDKRPIDSKRSPASSSLDAKSLTLDSAPTLTQDPRKLDETSRSTLGLAVLSSSSSSISPVLTKKPEAQLEASVLHIVQSATVAHTSSSSSEGLYHLPGGVVDLTKMSEMQIQEKFADKPDKMRVMIQLKTDLEQKIIPAIIDSHLNEPFQRILIAFAKNYDASNEVRRLLMDERTRPMLFEQLKKIQDIPSSSVVEVRGTEKILMEAAKLAAAKSGKRDIIFEDRSAVLNFDQTVVQSSAASSSASSKPVNRLDGFVAQRIARNPVFQGVVVNPGKPDQHISNSEQIAALLDKYSAEDVRTVRSDIDKIRTFAGVKKGGKEEETRAAFCSARVKGLGSLTVKIAGNRKSGSPKQVGDSTDLIGGRIIVDNYAEIAKVMTAVEKYYEGRILEISDKFVAPNGKTEATQSAYRAVHYIIKLDDNTCFELQIKTLPELMFGEIDHDVVYKDYYEFGIAVQRDITGRYWGLQAAELHEYTEASFSVESRTDISSGRSSAMISSVSPSITSSQLPSSATVPKGDEAKSSDSTKRN
jgi:ppGpp synthetase/RelA/SpoT-type nucleotidyltranferase